MRSAQSTLRSPEVIQGRRHAHVAAEADLTKAIHDSTTETNRSVVVISSAMREPAAAGSATWHDRREQRIVTA